MSEDVRRDPLLGTLARFQPAADDLDRDAMLFACGQAAAPNARPWRIATVSLVASHLLIAALWLATGSKSLPPVAPGPFEPSLPPSVPVNQPAPAGSYGELVRRWEQDGLLPPTTAAEPVQAEPALSIMAGRHAISSR